MSTEPVVFDCNKQFHILAFFRALDDMYQQQLHERCGFTEEMINQQLMSPASKFHPNFVANPLDLLNKLSSRIEKYICNPLIWNNDKAMFSIHFEKRNYPEGIGIDALYPLNKIYQTDLKKIHLIKQKYYKKKVYYTQEKLLTWEINVVLMNQKAPALVIMHPGKPAPPFPDMLYMGCRDFMESANFWRDHVIRASPD